MPPIRAKRQRLRGIALLRVILLLDFSCLPRVLYKTWRQSWLRYQGKHLSEYGHGRAGSSASLTLQFRA